MLSFESVANHPPSNESHHSSPPTAYVTSTPLPNDYQQQINSEEKLNIAPQIVGGNNPDKEEVKNAIISSLFEEIRLEATLFPDAQPSEPMEVEGNKTDNKLKKRKSELALEMTAEDVDDILGGDSTTSSNFNPNNPFGSLEPHHHIGQMFGEPSTSTSQTSSPPLTKYSQNNQGKRNSPPHRQFSAQFHPNLMHSSMLQPTNGGMTSSPPSNLGMHSPATNMHNSPLAIHAAQQSGSLAQMVPNGANGAPMHHHHHIPRLLTHQQSAPNLHYDDSSNQTRPFDQTLVEEFQMCVRVILMASYRTQCGNVYRLLTAEVSELYSRVVKHQVPKKAVKKIVATRAPLLPSEKFELERQFKCLSDGLQTRQSTQLYESIVNFLYKMRIAIPDS